MNSPTASWPLSSIVLILYGAALVAMGGFFFLQRPALLPEDLRFIGQSAAQVDTAVPGLRFWLLNVFRVMGGYIVAADRMLLAESALKKITARRKEEQKLSKRTRGLTK